jgi:hypothetical protein
LSHKANSHFATETSYACRFNLLLRGRHEKLDRKFLTRVKESSRQLKLMLALDGRKGARLEPHYLGLNDLRDLDVGSYVNPNWPFMPTMISR